MKYGNLQVKFKKFVESLVSGFGKQDTVHAFPVAFKVTPTVPTYLVLLHKNIIFNALLVYYEFGTIVTIELLKVSM